MSSTAALQPEVAPIVACTISRDVQNFDLLIEDMEAELGENWGDLSFDDARMFLSQPDAAGLEFVAIAIDQEDEDKLASIAELIKTSVANKIKNLGKKVKGGEDPTTVDTGTGGVDGSNG